ncbi:MAG: EamA family transporter [Marinilabiliales bacterium]|nr:MAG: EamA family transporter [Marinilabiliales bacterium]
MKSKSWVYILVILSMVFWGMTFVWTKIVLDYWEPVTIILFRLIVSSAIIFGFLKLFGRVQKVSKKDYGLFLLSAVFNPFIYFIGENYGVKHSSATVSAVIIATIPVFTAIAARTIYKERLSVINILGMVLSLAGIVVMLNGPEFNIRASGKGLIWLTMAVISAVFYAIVLKKLAVKYSSATIVATQNLIGIFLFLPLFFIFDFQQFTETKITGELITNIILLAIFGSSLAFIFFTIGTRELGVSRTNLFSNLIPFFTAVTSFIVLKEEFTAMKIVGMVTVIGGVVMSQIKRSRLTPPVT